MSTWRDKARPVISQVLQETRGQDPKDMRRAMRKAYPFGARRNWPYKVWLDEVRRQIAGERIFPRRPRARNMTVLDHPGQMVFE